MCLSNLTWPNPHLELCSMYPWTLCFARGQSP